MGGSLEVVSAAPVDAGLQNTPAVPVLVPVGAAMPDFELTDQAGDPSSVSAQRQGRGGHLNYSRCPLPDYCPRMVENFKAVRERFAARMDRDLVFLTISFDQTLRHAGSPEQVCGVATRGRTGLTFPHRRPGERLSASATRSASSTGRKKGLITHSLQTAVIDRNGRLAATVEGKDFTPTQLGDLVGAVLNQ